MPIIEGVSSNSPKTFTPVKVASDGSLVVTTSSAGGGSGSGTATLSNVNGSASSVTLLAANTARRSVFIENDSSAILYVKFGSSASTTSHTFILGPGDIYVEKSCDYPGVISGIWSSATGAARITEVT